jgi:hypothetical protein
MLLWLRLTEVYSVVDDFLALLTVFSRNLAEFLQCESTTIVENDIPDFVIREAMTFIIQAIVIAWLEQIIDIDPVAEIA